MSWLRGTAKRYDGAAIDYIHIFNWYTGACIANIKPNELGKWKYDYYEDLHCGIAYVSDGCEPVTHGRYDFPVIIKAPFVDFIGAVNSLDRGSGSAPIVTTIPSTVQEGDMFVLGVMRRGDVTVTDNNSGTWTHAASSSGDYDGGLQSTTIYYRHAKAGDAGKTITVGTSYSGRLIVYLSIYRGKYKRLTVTQVVSNPSRYDNSYSEAVKNLAPIEHDGGFIVRAVSNIYALSSGDTLGEISNMTNTGDVVRAYPQQIRLQVAYKHLETGSILKNVTYETGTTGSDEQIPDAAIILNEVTP